MVWMGRVLYFFNFLCPSLTLKTYNRIRLGYRTTNIPKDEVYLCPNFILKKIKYTKFPI